jgi:hypothetical protein
VIVARMSISACGDTGASVTIPSCPDDIPQSPDQPGETAMLRAALQAAEARIAALEQIIKGLQRARFGQSSGRVEAGQLVLELGRAPLTPEPANDTTAKPRDNTSNGQRRRNRGALGNPAGVVAWEAANSSSEGGSIATLLVIGVPFIFLASGIVRVPVRVLVPPVMILALLRPVRGIHRGIFTSSSGRRPPLGGEQLWSTKVIETPRGAM